MYTRLIPILLAGQLLIAAAVNYSYDAAGRLAKIDYGAAGSITYTYDNAGNVTSRTVLSSGAGASAITSAQLVRSGEGEARIEIRGTNLAAEGAIFTVDGKPARVLSRKMDRATIQAPDLEKSGRVRIVVTNGTGSSPPFWVNWPSN
jgi:YD repeat-containing protein